MTGVVGTIETLFIHRRANTRTETGWLERSAGLVVQSLMSLG